MEIYKTMRAQILLICITTSLVLVGCESGTDKNELRENVQSQAENVSPSKSPIPQNIDKPRLTSEEVSLIVYSNLNNLLPTEYKSTKFNRNTRSARYINKGKWEFQVSGSGETKASLPEEKVVESEILWRINQKEQITSFDLLLTANYNENLGISEIMSIEKYNIRTDNVTLSTNTMNAKLTVIYDNYSNNLLNHGFTVHVQNSGLIPIKGIILHISYSDPKSLEIERSFDYYLLPDQTAVLAIGFKDEIIFYYHYPYYYFLTGSGLKIPNDFSSEYYRNRTLKP